MSSILKALKKLEKEQPHEKTFESVTQTIDVKSSINREAKKDRFKRKISAGVLGIGLIVGAVFLIWKLAPFSGKPEAPIKIASIASKPIEKKVPEVKSKPAEPRPNPEKKTASKIPSMPPPKKIPQQIQKPDKDDSVLNEPAEKSNEETEPKLQPIQKQPVLEKIDNPISETNKKSLKNESPTKKRKPMDNFGLTLQAIAWSDNPERRFAVIDNSIVREGGTVNGVHITGIYEDYVSLLSDNKEGELRYGR